jgi:hypothetical protein
VILFGCGALVLRIAAHAQTWQDPYCTPRIDPYYRNGNGSARTNPVPNTPEVLVEARAHWADHCATCHANDGAGATPMNQHTYPPAPDMRVPATQQMSDGELFYIIQDGIRLSGMPAWGSGSDQDAQDSWKLVHFIRHLPQLTVEEKDAMKKLNRKSPEELKEEEEEEGYLKGEDINDHSVTPQDRRRSENPGV